LVRHRLIVLLGATPLRQVIGTSEKLSNRRGQLWTDGDHRYLLIYHPAAASGSQPSAQ
jgi:uracil-DNA glycosylase